MADTPTAATIAEWRQLAKRPQEHHYMRNAINRACDEIERLQGIHIGLDADIIHAVYRAEAAEARVKEIETYGSWHPEKMLLEKRIATLEEANRCLSNTQNLELTKRLNIEQELRDERDLKKRIAALEEALCKK